LATRKTTRSTAPKDETAPKESTSPWRPAIPIQSTEWAELLAKAAVQLNIEGVQGPEAFEDTRLTDDRTAKSKLIVEIVKVALEAVVSGSGNGVELSDKPEPFFQRARTKPTDGELRSQQSAIVSFLGLEPTNQIVISEAELVGHALKAAREMKYGEEYGLNDLVHEGIRRVGQELVSNAANNLNRDPDAPLSPTAPGRNWNAYAKAYNDLKAQLGTPAWPYRKPFITASTIAGYVQPQSNPIQIRRWMASVGLEEVAVPKPGEDQTAGGQIVDPKRTA
jgi:hypothetical protein